MLPDEPMSCGRPQQMGKMPHGLDPRMWELAESIKKACDGNDPSLLRSILNQYPSVDINRLEDEADLVSPFLNAAAESGFADIVSVLLDVGQVDVDSVGEFGTSSLFDACFFDRIDAVKALLSRQADTEMEDPDGSTPLYACVCKGHLACLNALLRAGARFEYHRSKDKLTPLHAAVLGGHTECAMRLIEAGHSLDAKDSDGNTPLVSAATAGCCNSRKTCMVELVKAGANVNASNNAGRTALHSMLLAPIGCPTCISNTAEILLTAEAGVNIPDANGYTVIGHTEYFRIMPRLLALVRRAHRRETMRGKLKLKEEKQEHDQQEPPPTLEAQEAAAAAAEAMLLAEEEAEVARKKSKSAKAKEKAKKKKERKKEKKKEAEVPVTSLLKSNDAHQETGTSPFGQLGPEQSSCPSSLDHNHQSQQAYSSADAQQQAQIAERPVIHSPEKSALCESNVESSPYGASPFSNASTQKLHQYDCANSDDRSMTISSRSSSNAETESSAQAMAHEELVETGEPCVITQSGTSRIQSEDCLPQACLSEDEEDESEIDLFRQRLSDIWVSETLVPLELSPDSVRCQLRKLCENHVMSVSTARAQ